MFPEPDEFGLSFYELFRVLPDTKKKLEWKKHKKGKSKGKENRKPKIELVGEVPPEIEVAGNASSFAVFSTVRLAVLERWMKEANDLYLTSSSSAPPQSASNSDSEDENSPPTPQPARIPKIVGVGLRSVFELIKESRSSHPALCTKALTALLDVVQGHQPEGLKLEPPEVVEPLLELLLELATMPQEGSSNSASHLTSVACSCLIALVIARGDTGKLLSALAALLMCPHSVSQQNIHMPSILGALQKSVLGVVLGKTVAPDWITHGIPKSALLAQHEIYAKPELSSDYTIVDKAIASDGLYLYVHTSIGLLKMGSGYGGTLKGHIYIHKPDFFPNKTGWLGYAQGKLYFRLGKGSSDRGELLTVNSETLEVKEVGKIDSPGVMFSDGENLGIVTPTKEDGFVVRSVNPSSLPLNFVSELPLKLARKCVVAFGYAMFDEETSLHNLNSGVEEETASIVSGKEFSLIRTTAGKLYFSGKPSCLGLKQGGKGGIGKWSELIIPKAPKIVQVAAGHDGMHAVLVAEDGSVYFTGTARRGEDGDHSKVRRQPKAVKPKKMMKVDGYVIVYAACNNGTTALVSKDGELLMFGKDTNHCEPNTGFVTDLRNVHVTQVALGKAHAVAVTNKGHLYTFGINNKGQCGREYSNQVKEGKFFFFLSLFLFYQYKTFCAATIAMETAVEEEGGEEEEGEWGDEGGMCPPGQHKWKQDLCMVCTVCRECTGYSISCLSSMSTDRIPGQECGCGEGDSGCSQCGACRICARENVDNSDMAILGPSGASDIAGMMRLDLIFGANGAVIAGRPGGGRFQDHLQCRLEERKQRQHAKLSSKHSAVLKLKGASAIGHRAPGCMIPQAKVILCKAALSGQPNNIGADAVMPVGKDAVGSDVERDASRVSSLPPAMVVLPVDSPVIQIACGLHHTVVLVQSGEVFTFGSNSYGQLGVGDIMVRGGPVQVRLSAPAMHIAAGGNHTVVLTTSGHVYTFGSHQKGQLGRGTMSVSGGEGTSKRIDFGRSPWHSIPGSVSWVGPRQGRRATWVGASADQTYLKVDESLINSVSLSHSTIMANRTCIVLVPKKCEEDKSFSCLVINKRDGNCCSFSEQDQIDFSESSVCLDPVYNVLWSYNRGQLRCYNAVCSEAKFGVWSILSGQLALPTIPGHTVTRSQAALHLLAALDTLTSTEHILSPTAEEKRARQSHTKVYSKEDFSTVSRFESHGGGWGYSGHSIEAIRFMSDTDILIGGFGLFGGRGEYTGKIKLFDIGTEGGEQENDGELLAETEEIPYECGPRQKYPMLFEEPISLLANRWYVAWARVSGPSSDCGSSGQGMVTTEDQVVFYFKSSKKSNNGTDVNAGQIPQLLYRVVTPESQAPNRQADSSEPACILSREFSRAVTRDGLQSLLALLRWSWSTFKVGLLDMVNSLYTNAHQYEFRIGIQEQERLVYISKACLRLLRMYTNEIYPNQIVCKRQVPESVLLAECVGDIRALLKQILSDTTVKCDPRPKGILAVGANKQLVEDIMNECHHTFVACFHAFYPTAYLKWTALCDLLASINRKNNGGIDQLLTSLLASLRCPSIRLRSTFPILSPNMDAPDSLKKQLSPSDNSGLPMMPYLDTHHYPILVEQMSYRSQIEGGGLGSGWVLRDVLDRLLDIVTIPVKESLYEAPLSYSMKLTFNACHILSRIVAELAIFASGTTDDMDGACGRVLHSTPSRFTRTNQSRTWNTGNGSPDAICLSVDRPGVVIAGVGVYGGVGSYDYELEILDDSNTSYDHTHTQRWNSLQVTRGSFGPEDCLNDDIAEIKFDFPVFVKENVKYAIRLRNHGGRTSNGDGGLSTVKGPDGVVFTFSTCSLSFNGTTQTRGQIPTILYYSNPQDSETHAQNKGAIESQARRITLNVTSAIVTRCSEVLAMGRDVDNIKSYDTLSTSHLVRILLPLVVANISPLATSDPRSAVQVLGLLQELLPHVSALNLLHYESFRSCSDETAHDQAGVTTSNHRAWVESDHPYKPATVSNYKVVFPDSVQWMALEFTVDCGTAQAEDSLQLYIPANRRLCISGEDINSDLTPYWPVLHRFNNNPALWPQSAVILPGNEVVFSLETASDYVKDEKANFYGFKCLVTGYDWHTDIYDGLKLLETELAFLGGMCSASLMKKDLILPPSSADELDEDMEVVEELAQQVYSKHSSLLGKGFALANPLSINQALDGVLPYSCHSNERLFLRDFVQCAPGTSGGRLSRWLQPESYVDPGRSELLYSREDMRCGWPALLTVLTKDQYGDVVHVPSLKIEVKAVPIDKKELGGSDANRKMRRISQPDELTFGGHALPCLDVPYEVTIKDKMCYAAITIMKAYENYSFEELRYTSPVIKRSSENMLVRPNCDGSYSATWTPASIGWYSILTTIDGYPMHEGYKVEVKEPPQGMTPPSQSVVRKATQQPNKLRKFVARNSAGLRVRAHPSLQSEQIGVVHVNGTIAFIDEIHNDDGVWLRLNQETIRQYCEGAYAEAWCLQFNQHLGKTLLLPVQEPKSIIENAIRDPNVRKSPIIESPKTKRATQYRVVKCGASGHNIRSNPSLKAPPVGMLTQGNCITVIDHVENNDGTWVELDEESLNKHCFNWDGEAWALAINRENVYLRPESVEKDKEFTDECTGEGDDEFFSNSQMQISQSGKRAFDFTSTSFPMFSSQGTSSNQLPFVFGSTSHQESVVPAGGQKEDSRSIFREVPKSPALTKWLKSDDKPQPDKKTACSSIKDLPPELLGVSVKELVKAIGESRANGNGVTPPDTPRKASRSSSPLPPSRTSHSASSSPLPIPALPGRHRSQGAKGSLGLQQDSMSSSPLAYGSPRSIAWSPAVGIGGESTSQRRGSTQSDTSALVSSLTRDLTPSPSGSCSLHSPNSTPSTPRKTKETNTFAPDTDSSSKSMAQAGTQTSPESAGLVDRSKPNQQFSSGSNENRSSCRKSRVQAATSSSGKKSMSPPPIVHPRHHKGPIKEAMSPSVAESLRATFAAFLWHEGIVHDAMACASFLKFHPNLPKEGALVVTRPTDRVRTADQRHSLEVSTAGNYLHIKPSTLETLTRSAANANANRHRGKQQSVIREEGTSSAGTSEHKSQVGDARVGEHTVTVLPPALKCLVHLWEQLTLTCLQAFTVNSIFPSPTAPSGSMSKNSGENKRNARKKKDWKSSGGRCSGERMGSCELCGGVFPHPVTYHMRQMHAGCGAHAGGKGYNSGGSFCVGWAGNCGDGGFGQSSWYLICDGCRDKYLRLKKQGSTQGVKKPSRKKAAVTMPPPQPSPSCKITSPTSNTSAVTDTHLVMKNNAMFLLELSGGAQKRLTSSGGNSSLNALRETPQDQAFPPPGPFQCLLSLDAIQVNPSGWKDSHFSSTSENVVIRRRDSDNNTNSRPVSEGLTSDSDSESGKGRLFHRSVSMGTNGAPWAKKEGDMKVIVTRKRNNSTCDMVNETGSSLLCYPSAALQKLVPSMSQSAIVNNTTERLTVDLLSRPVLTFLLQQHNLPSLHLAMKQALRKATCRVYGMQALDWLLHTVTQATCLHDLLWWFVAALTPTPAPPDHDLEQPQLKDLELPEKSDKKDEHELRGVCEHPLNDMGIAGEAVHPLPSTFHNLLQTIADLMLLLPMGSALQQMAVRCWGINFTQADHMFLHRSHVFSNISKILSRTEEEQEDAMSMQESHLSANSQSSSFVEVLADLTSTVEIKASSRQAMVGSLTDNSTETFWESGDEDRNKTKTLTITCPPRSQPRVIYIHIDNCRDLANKVSSVTFQSGPNVDELFKLQTVEVESRATGWISCSITYDQHSIIRLELKGGDNSMRIRQVRILGRIEGESLRLKRQHSAMTIQQRNTEAETLRVFRLITSQVFGKLITGEEEVPAVEAEGNEESNDLKEHMVGILFSRSKLTHLQKQVCVHIVQAIRKEAIVMREEWETRLCSASTATSAEAPDTYCFEMLSMVLALSGSTVGRSYLAHQHALLSDLLSLLHTGSARVQRQVTALLRRMLAEVSPATLAHILGIKHLPPTDFSIVTTLSRSSDSNVFDCHKMGILDVFLSCIAKALTVQVKTKGKESKGVSSISLATCIHPRDNIGSRWWLRGCISRKLAEDIIGLIRDMASGKLNESWAYVTKGAVAENILNLTRLNEAQRTSNDCLRNPTLWLALASLCVLDRDHVERLSSGQWRNSADGKPPPPRPTCNNHDDGETNAIIQCNVCGSLCAECDRYLHLHRRTRMHQRQVCKEEEEAIKVDLHEGCGRTKLFWALLLADSSTLKALVEFREGTRTQPCGTGVCRFCGASGSSGLLSIGNVCADHECQEHARNACGKVHMCGHGCGGIANEVECLPCLYGCSPEATMLKQDADDMCMICFIEALSSAPAVQLKCGHVFHLHCCRNVLTKRWFGPRITFSFAQCPICKSPIEHTILSKQLEPVKELMEDVRRKAVMRLEYEGLDKGRPDPAAYAMDRYAYYVCFKCKKAYYGGEARCDAELGSGEFDPSELVCGACSDVSRAQMCPKHGTDFLEYKCRYCCSVAVFFCFGTTHFCNACHDDFQRVTNIPKNELPPCPAGPKAKLLEGEECPLHVKHPPTGEEFALGCGVCRNAHTF
ncbi:E3 ubiquitin-protein ligase MYCBP2 isoform X3 [Cimex lectularius]|uniref:RCR-type E3 ubiquitin transferase n=1 Tax=Cimex lectularius TaxID=79782 RepID=A0A8I6SPS3_CIMLE|nr:E3 ubiquitin-protein ligase MYCBP2 isoform X3 [Cimex lectularius]